MTEAELLKRKERAEKEQLIISRTEKDFRVYTPQNPGKFYVVDGVPKSPSCTCPDYEVNAKDPEWRCEHIFAVLNHLEKANGQATAKDPEEERYEKEEREAIQNENSLPGAGGNTPKELPAPVSQMLIKRSVSPDGRIDSLSVEFTCPVGDGPGEVKEKAKSILDLQGEILQGFLNGAKSTKNGEPKTPEKEKEEKPKETRNDGSAPAQMVGIGCMNTKRGWQLFINVDVNGKTLKLFGSQKKLARYIVAAGFPDMEDRIKEGFPLNLPCRVVTQPSDDGKYTNIVEVLPIEALKFQRKPAK